MALNFKKMASALKDFAAQSITALKNFTMSDNKDSKDGIPSSPSKLPPLQARKAACTHTSVTRLYGLYPCSHCGKTSEFGWVYRCTQDYDGQLPPWEGGPIPSFEEPPPENHAGDSAMARTDATASPSHIEDGGEKVPEKPNEGLKEEPEEPALRLKPWMEKAIAEGHYTEEQAVTLRRQRQEVLERIKESEASFHYHRTTNKRLSGQAARRMSHRNTSINGFGITVPVVQQESEVDPAPGSAIALKMFPDCAYKSCQSCRYVHILLCRDPV